MGTPQGRLQLISSQTLGAHIPRRLVALLDTIARADHISREHVVRRWCADSARWASSGRHVAHRDRRRVMISM